MLMTCVYELLDFDPISDSLDIDGHLIPFLMSSALRLSKLASISALLA